jgi:hypothetical protein
MAQVASCQPLCDKIQVATCYRTRVYMFSSNLIINRISSCFDWDVVTSNRVGFRADAIFTRLVIDCLQNTIINYT